MRKFGIWLNIWLVLNVIMVLMEFIGFDLI